MAVAGPEGTGTVENVTVTIRCTDDVASCAELTAAAQPPGPFALTADQHERTLTRPGLVLWAAHDAGRLVGFGAASRNGIGTDPLLDYICVAPDQRGTGTGTALIDFFETVLFPEAPRLCLFVPDTNPGAQRLYERLGYRPAPDRTDATEYLWVKQRIPTHQAAA